MEHQITTGVHRLRCPFCETGDLMPVIRGLARCPSCGSSLDREFLETLRQISALPDAAGHHACECGHPEMRRLRTECSTARPADRKSYLYSDRDDEFREQ